MQKSDCEIIKISLQGYIVYPFMTTIGTPNIEFPIVNNVWLLTSSWLIVVAKKTKRIIYNATVSEEG